MNFNPSMKHLSILVALVAILATLAACTKSAPPSGPLARGELPAALRDAFVQVEITPQSAEGEYPPGAFIDAMQQKRPALKPGYLVAPDLVSRASVAGLRPYDLIIEVNDQPVTTPAAFAEQAKAGGKLRLLTRRMSQTRIVTLDIAASE